jgi:predicted CopG family antitoxin
MPSRNIAVQKATYDTLQREKRAGESFTQTIRRLLDRPGRLEDLLGAWGTSGARADRARLARLRAPNRVR